MGSSETLARGALATVRAAYAFERPRSDWFDCIADAVRPLVDFGHGATMGEYAVGNNGMPEILAFAQRGGDADFLANANATQRVAPRSWVERFYFSPGYIGTIVRCPDIPAVDIAPIAAIYKEIGFDDMMGACAGWEPGRGVFMCGPLKDDTVTSSESWRRLMGSALSHVRVSMRLQDRLAFAPDDAVLEPGTGRVIHAEGAARSATAQQHLRAQAKAIDRAKCRSALDDPGGALAVWQGLVRGTWSLVDQFDSDGRHYVIAKRNLTTTGSFAALSAREREVAMLAATGVANKAIGYELGIAASTVATHIQRAITKLGCGTRVALCRLARRAWNGGDDA